MKGTTVKKVFSRDSGDEPSNINCIVTNLWLGNLKAASDVLLLEEKKIKYILSINSFSLPKEISYLSDIKILHIEVLDSPNDDILSHFDEAYEFIECSIKKGAVLVHCYHGISRSVTIVVAYLMKKKRLTLEAALTYVKTKQNFIQPNPGFLTQLKLYEKMHWTLDKSNVQYKMLRLHIAASHIKNASILPEYSMDVIKDDPLIVATSTNSTVYRCKKCRRIVAKDFSLMPHVLRGKYSWSECLENTTICQMSYFIEPLSWMENVASSFEGKLLCPNKTCKNKLGSFSWTIGCRCPCGTHVCPGFYLIPSKVDKLMKS